MYLMIHHNLHLLNWNYNYYKLLVLNHLKNIHI